MEITAYALAERWIGTKELPGAGSNPFVLAMLRLDASWPGGDHVPWCSAFVNFVAWQLRLPRSKSLAARSWLAVGRPVDRAEARPGFDVVVLNRAGGPADPMKLDAPGHVGFFGGLEALGSSRPRVWVLGGNQGDAVSLAQFDSVDILGIRRLIA